MKIEKTCVALVVVGRNGRQQGETSKIREVRKQRTLQHSRKEQKDKRMGFKVLGGLEGQIGQGRLALFIWQAGLVGLCGVDFDWMSCVGRMFWVH